MRLIYYRDGQPAAVLEVPDEIVQFPPGAVGLPDDGKNLIRVVEGHIPEEDLERIPVGYDILGWINGYANVAAAYAGEPYFGLEEDAEEDAEA